MDEEDSMDGTEITESIDPQETGETLFLIFFIHIGFTESDIRFELAPQVASCSALKGMLVKVDESPCPGEGWMRAFS